MLNHISASGRAAYPCFDIMATQTASVRRQNGLKYYFTDKDGQRKEKAQTFESDRCKIERDRRYDHRPVRAGEVARAEAFNPANK